MTASNACLSDTELETIASGAADLDAHTLTHIDSCQGCQNRLAQLSCSLPMVADLTRLREKRQKTDALLAAEAQLKLGRNTRAPSNQSWSQAQEDNILAILHEEFDTVEQIGRGGMGLVYKARQKSLDRVVAVKVLSPLLADEASARERFVREARAAAAIQHTNVITIHAISEKTSLPYIVMEYVHGHSLQAELDSGRKPNINNVVRIGQQLASALAAAHRRGVVHRDVKPANIFLDLHAKKVLLGDFGLALANQHSELTRTGTVVGTPAFVAPEALQPNENIDHRADLFSLGAVMYAMCVGQSPFQCNSILSTLHQISSVHPTPLCEHNSGIPVWLSDVVMKLLEKQPQLRFQNAEDVQAALSSPVANPKLDNDRTAPTSNLRTSIIPNISLRFVVLTTTAVAALFYILMAVTLNYNNTQNIDPPITLLSQASDILGQHDDLVDAVRMARDGQEIQIASNQTLTIRESLFVHTDIEIKAASGFSPVLEFRPLDSPDAEALLVTDSHVTLSGVELRIPAAAEEFYSAIEIQGNGSLLLDRCLVHVEHDGIGVSNESNALVKITNSFLHTPHAISISLGSEEGRTVLENTRVVGAVGIEFVPESQNGIHIYDSKFICDHICTVVYSREDEQAENELQAEHSLFLALQDFLACDEDEDQDDGLANVRWSGNQNTFAGQIPDIDLLGLPDTSWDEFLQSEDSEYQRSPFDLPIENLEDVVPHELHFNVQQLD